MAVNSKQINAYLQNQVRSQQTFGIQEEAKQQQPTLEREFTLHQEEVLQQEEIRKQDEANIENEAIKLVEALNQESAIKLEEAKKQNEVRTQQIFIQQNEAIMQAPTFQSELALQQKHWQQEQALQQEGNRKQEEARIENEAMKLIEGMKHELSINFENVIQEAKQHAEEKARKIQDARSSNESVSSRRQEKAAKHLDPIKQRNINNEIENHAYFLQANYPGNRSLYSQSQINDATNKAAAKYREDINEKKSKNQSASKELIYRINDISCNLLDVVSCIKRGAYIDYQDSGTESTALMYALSHHHDLIAEYLLNNGADPLLVDKNGIKARDLVSKDSALYGIIIKREIEIAPLKDGTKYYRNYLTGPTNKVVFDEIAARSKCMVSAKSTKIRELHKSLEAELKKSPPSLAVIKLILMGGADINYFDNDYYFYTPLMTAIIHQNDYIAEYLLNQGANPLLENIYGEIASDLSARNSSIYILLQKREKELRLEVLSPSEKYSLLLQDYVSLFDAKAKKIDEYLALGADIDYQNLDGYTALMIAVEEQNVRIVEYLLKNGSNPFLKNKYGKTAKFLANRNDEIFQIIKGYEFLFAAIEDDLFMMSALLRADPNIIDFQGKDGYTALLITTEQGSKESVDFLLMQGADTTITCDDGKGAIELTSDESIIALFLQTQDEEFFDDDFEVSQNLYSFFGEKIEVSPSKSNDMEIKTEHSTIW
ncbi:MAG: ankyrin repeat domain-containing protein [Tatlockia sp.]|nr:ankyrin repeat domain-containing protein [Tatlockia sp.]